MYLHSRSILVLTIISVSTWSEKSLAADCYAYPLTCTLSCNGESLAYLIERVNRMWDENLEKCEASGMRLTMEKIIFPNKTIHEGWFTPDIILNELQMTLTNVEKIEISAFVAKPFLGVKELFIKLSLGSVDSDILNGFTSLERLVLSFAVLPEHISTNVLNVSSKTLKQIIISTGGTDFVNPKYNILKLDNLTGSDVLTTLEELNVQIPLNDSITRKTFIGLTNIRRIELESCQITNIGKGSFDSIGPNLTALFLTNNKITTLPNDLFKRILLNVDLQIYLAGNLWNCDCNLANFQKYLIDYQQHFNENLITCTSPSKKETERVRLTELNENEECFLSKECYSDSLQQNIMETVYISVPSASISLVETNTNDLVISSEELSNVPTYIWYGGQEPINGESEEIYCIRGFNVTIESNLLLENIAYTFCYIAEDMTGTSPFNCITYMKMGAVPQTWYSKNSKIYVIAVIIASLLLSLLFGIVGGVTFLKIKQRVIDYVYNYGTTKPISTEITTTPPPLPERPKTLNEMDPVYAYVE